MDEEKPRQNFHGSPDDPVGLFVVLCGLVHVEMRRSVAERIKVAGVDCRFLCHDMG